MIIKTSDRREMQIMGAFSQFAGGIVIVWGFLIPVPFSIQIMIALSVTFVLFVSSHILSAIQFARKEAGAYSWGDTLVLRLAINEVISSVRQGEYASIAIDWQKVTQEAFEDINSAQKEDKFREGFPLAGAVMWLITIPLMVVAFVFYPVGGYLIALLIKTFIPGIAGL